MKLSGKSIVTGSTPSPSKRERRRRDGLTTPAGWAVIATGLCAAALLPLVSCSAGPKDRFEAAEAAVRRLEARVPDVIASEERAARVTMGLRRWRAIIDQLETLDTESVEALTRMNADPATTRAALEESARSFDVRRRALLGQILDERQTLIELTTPREWIALGGTAR